MNMYRIVREIELERQHRNFRWLGQHLPTSTPKAIDFLGLPSLFSKQRIHLSFRGAKEPLQSVFRAYASTLFTNPKTQGIFSTLTQVFYKEWVQWNNKEWLSKPNKQVESTKRVEWLSQLNQKMKSSIVCKKTRFSKES